jgi:hypothetical protein
MRKYLLKMKLCLSKVTARGGVAPGLPYITGIKYSVAPAANILIAVPPTI